VTTKIAGGVTRRKETLCSMGSGNPIGKKEHKFLGSIEQLRGNNRSGGKVIKGNKKEDGQERIG